MLVAALAAGALLLPSRAGAQAPRPIAEGVFLRSDRARPTVAWVDLGPDVLAIVGGPSSPSVATIRRLAGKPARAVFAPNGTGLVLGGAVELVPASRGPANGGLEFRGTMTLGTRRVEIRELERAVSAGNGIVYLPEARVLFAGDLVGDGAVREQSVAILGEHRRVPDRFIDTQAHKPAKQQVEVELLDQLPLAAHGIEDLEQEGPQQLLRRDRRAAAAGVQGLKRRRQLTQHRLDQGLHGPERMVGGDALLQADDAEQRTLGRFRTTHGRARQVRVFHVRRMPLSRQGLIRDPFSATC